MMTMGCVDRLSSREELPGLLDSFQLRVLAIMTFQVQKAGDMDNVEVFSRSLELGMQGSVGADSAVSDGALCLIALPSRY